MTTRTFQFSLPIHADPSTVLGLLGSYSRWGELFPSTIHQARLVESANGQDVVEVIHRWYGHIFNVVSRPSPDRMLIDEYKPNFCASFDLLCSPALHGSQVDALLNVGLRGWKTVFAQLIGPYARRQTRRYFLEPLKIAAEQEGARSLT